ncbi:hypothetical protein M0802_006412 [Mischocyttarus mexicanus]|nr:hypothetical protein M0802_006412 [Mischocyttarus mexicanus]
MRNRVCTQFIEKRLQLIEKKMDKELFFSSLQLQQKTNHQNVPSLLESRTRADCLLFTRKSRCRGSYKKEESCKIQQLIKWIRRIQRKKLNCRKNRQRNLRIEAVLGHALCNAEYNLMTKQILKTSKFKQNEEQNYSDAIAQYNKTKDEPLCPELASFDNFMKRVSNVKVPLPR